MTSLYTPNQIIKRSEIHDQYGGNRQSGISYPKELPYIFIFSSGAGHQHGYKDQWENPNVFSYSGEGQVGDMQFTRGNLELSKQKQTGKRVFLFIEMKRSFVKFEDELELDDIDFFIGLDKNRNNRTGIKFFLKRVGKILDYTIGSAHMPVIEEPPSQGYSDTPSVTEREGLVTSRVGQGAYRKSILYRWENKCAVTNYANNNILIASHIVSWKDSTNNERLDVANGILLSPVYDALFDQHLISFENTGRIVLSNALVNTDYRLIGVTGQESIKDFHSDNLPYLERHRTSLK